MTVLAVFAGNVTVVNINIIDVKKQKIIDSFKQTFQSLLSAQKE